MMYKPERALTPIETSEVEGDFIIDVEMMYKPERALTPGDLSSLQ